MVRRQLIKWLSEEQDFLVQIKKKISIHSERKEENSPKKAIYFYFLTKLKFRTRYSVVSSVNLCNYGTLYTDLISR